MSETTSGDIQHLTDAMVASYRQSDDGQRIGEDSLPSRERIVDIVNWTRKALFPGYFGGLRLTWENIAFRIGALLSQLADDLADEIRHCIVTIQRRHGASVDAADGKARQIATDFLQRLLELRRLLILDADAALVGDPAAVSTDEIIYCYPGYYAVTVYRIAHELLRLGVPLMPRIMTEHAHSVTGCDIHPGATIGERFFIDHATGVIIGETSVIGDNVKIYQGVTLGGFSFQRGVKRHPTLEDEVTVYANATILGGDTVIGKGATVNGNVFVTKSIEPEHTVTPTHPELKVRSKKK